jgi:hypothetical protein
MAVCSDWHLFLSPLVHTHSRHPCRLVASQQCKRLVRAPFNARSRSQSAPVVLLQMRKQLATNTLQFSYNEWFDAEPFLLH